MKKNVLVIVAHPDDEVLGCGGTIARQVREGDQVTVLILGEGKTSRIGKIKSVKSEIATLKEESEKAGIILGVHKLILKDLPDNRFDSLPLLEIVQIIEAVKEEYQPDLIYTHHFGDMNIDHTLTHRAVLTATRPMPGEKVTGVYAFENPSSTEWNSYDRAHSFVPNYFVNIEETIDVKVQALACYQSELRDYPHPRSLQHIQELAKVNGNKVGLPYAENFQVIREIIK